MEGVDINPGGDLDVNALGDAIDDEELGVEDFDDRLPDFDATFSIKVINVVKTPGLNTNYEFQLIAKANKRITEDREYYVQAMDNRFSQAIDEWQLETGEFLDIVPGGQRNQEEFVKQAVRAYYNSEDPDAEGFDGRERLQMKRPGLKLIKGDLYFIPRADSLFKLKKPDAEGDLVVQINPDEADFQIILKSEGFKLGKAPSGKIKRVLSPNLSEDIEDAATVTQPESNFKTDEKQALVLLFEMLEAIESVKDDVSQSSLLAFFLEFLRSMMYDHLKINHKLTVLCSEEPNCCKSAYMKMMSLAAFGYKLPMKRGFTLGFLSQELVIPNSIVFIDELLKSDPVGEAAQGQWSRGFKGTMTSKKTKKEELQPVSTMILSTNKKLSDFATFHKIEKSTLDKFEFNFLGYKTVFEMNPLGFEASMLKVENAAEQMFQFIPVYYAFVWSVAKNRVTGLELSAMSSYCEKMDERLGQSLVHLHRLYLLLKQKGTQHGLHLPRCLVKFDPQCLTEGLSGDKTLKDLIKFLVDNFAVHVLEPIAGSNSIRLKDDELENLSWCPKWSKNTYKKIPKDAHKREKGKYRRNVRVTKEHVGLELLNKAQKMMKVDVSKVGEQVALISKKRCESLEKEGIEAVKKIISNETERPAKRVKLSSDESSKEKESQNKVGTQDSPSAQLSVEKSKNKTVKEREKNKGGGTKNCSDGQLKILDKMGTQDSLSAQMLVEKSKNKPNKEREKNGEARTKKCSDDQLKIPDKVGTQDSLSAQMSVEKSSNKPQKEGEPNGETRTMNCSDDQLRIHSDDSEDCDSDNLERMMMSSYEYDAVHKQVGNPLIFEPANVFAQSPPPLSNGKSPLQSVPSRSKKGSFNCGIPGCKSFGNKLLIRRSNRKTATELLKEKNERILEQLRKDNDDEIGLEVKEFPDKGRGVVTTKDRRKNEFILEYAGNLLTLDSANERESEYSKDFRIGCYMFYFAHQGKNYCIDATKETGRMGRLLNHSSKHPNLIPKVMMVDGSPRLYLVARQDIVAGQELVYDYGDRDKATLRAFPFLSQ